MSIRFTVVARPLSRAFSTSSPLLRLEEDKLCLLVIVGVRADGTKELVALADGYRESTGSRADLLRE